MSPNAEALYGELPNLRDSDHQLTSPPTDDYNCVAWVQRDYGQWWQPGNVPGYYWPDWAPHPTGDDDLDCYVALFEGCGYRVCDSGEREDGLLKIAIYAKGREFHHVAKQLRDGDWSSKVGVSNDLRHASLDALYGAPYFEGATATVFMAKTDDGIDMTVDEGRLLLP